MLSKFNSSAPTCEAFLIIPSWNLACQLPALIAMFFVAGERVGTSHFWKILAHKLQIILHCGYKKKEGAKKKGRKKEKPFSVLYQCDSSSLSILLVLMFLSGTAAT